MESSKQVWSAEEGYPGDGDYRDFYRDVGYDLEYDYIRPYIQPNGQRKFTGLKYHRIGYRVPSRSKMMPRIGAGAGFMGEWTSPFARSRCGVDDFRYFTTLRKLLAKEPRLRVLFTSGYPAAQVVHHGIAEAVAAFIEKPFLFAALPVQSGEPSG